MGKTLFMNKHKKDDSKIRFFSGVLMLVLALVNLIVGLKNGAFSGLEIVNITLLPIVGLYHVIGGIKDKRNLDF